MLPPATRCLNYFNQMTSLCKFNLQFPFPCPGALRKNIKNQCRTVLNAAIEDFFQITGLGGGQFIIENDSVHAFSLAKLSST